MRKWLLGVFSVAGLVLLILFLSAVFSGRLILPQYFSVGPLVVHYYGLTMAAAVALGFYLAIKRAPLYGLNANDGENILFWITIFGFIGARLYHVASSYTYYAAHPLDIIKVWNGGLSIYGAVFGGLLVLWFCKKTYKLPPTSYKLFNWLTPSLIIGQIIGRFGNMFNYEAFGYNTSLPWKMFVPQQFRPEMFEQFKFFHPWFLYEQIGLLAIFFAIARLRKLQNPHLFLWYLLLYNTLRFGLEFLRIDSTFIGSFRLNAIVSLALAIIAGAMIVFVHKDDKKVQ